MHDLRRLFTRRHFLAGSVASIGVVGAGAVLGATTPNELELEARQLDDTARILRDAADQLRRCGATTTTNPDGSTTTTIGPTTITTTPDGTTTTTTTLPDGTTITSTTLPDGTTTTTITGQPPTWSGNVSLPSGFVVPAGETYSLDPNADTTLTIGADSTVLGVLRSRPASSVVQHRLQFAAGTGLYVLGAGSLDIQGTPKTAWNRTGTDPTWLIDDELMSTPVQSGDYTLDSYLQGSPVPSISNEHGTFTAEILNLTRNVIFAGGDRIQIEATVPQIVRYARIEDFGDASQLGHYPLHFHKMTDGSRGSTVEGVVIVRGRHHAFVPHASHGITFTGCIAVSTVGDAYWWDLPEGDTTNDTADVVWDRCVAAVTTPGGVSGFPNVAGFNLGSGANSIIRGSVAVGTGGSPDAAGFHWPSQARSPNRWVFDDNIGHNNPVHGIFVWKNDHEDHPDFNRFIGYHNGRYGYKHGAYVGTAWHFVDGLLFGNGFGSYRQQIQRPTSSGGNPYTGEVPSVERSILDGQLVLGDHNAPGILEFEGTQVDAFIYRDTEIIGGVLVAEDGKGRGSYGFIRCLGAEPDDFTFESVEPDSRIRIQRIDGTAVQSVGGGPWIPIPPFA